MFRTQVFNLARQIAKATGLPFNEALAKSWLVYRFKKAGYHHRALFFIDNKLRRLGEFCNSGVNILIRINGQNTWILIRKEDMSFIMSGEDKVSIMHNSLGMQPRKNTKVWESNPYQGFKRDPMNPYLSPSA